MGWYLESRSSTLLDLFQPVRQLGRSLNTQRYCSDIAFKHSSLSTHLPYRQKNYRPYTSSSACTIHTLFCFHALPLLWNNKLLHICNLYNSDLQMWFIGWILKRQRAWTSLHLCIQWYFIHTSTWSFWFSVRYRNKKKKSQKLKWLSVICAFRLILHQCFSVSACRACFYAQRGHQAGDMQKMPIVTYCDILLRKFLVVSQTQSPHVTRAW